MEQERQNGVSKCPFFAFRNTRGFGHMKGKCVDLRCGQALNCNKEVIWLINTSCCFLPSNGCRPTSDLFTYKLYVLYIIEWLLALWMMLKTLENCFTESNLGCLTVRSCWNSSGTSCTYQTFLQTALNAQKVIRTVLHQKSLTQKAHCPDLHAWPFEWNCNVFFKHSLS